MGCSTNKSTPQQEGKARKVHLGVRSCSTPEEKKAAARELFLQEVRKIAPDAYPGLRGEWQPSALLDGKRVYYSRHINPVLRLCNVPRPLEVHTYETAGKQEGGEVYQELVACCSSWTTDEHIRRALHELARRCKEVARKPHLQELLDSQHKDYSSTPKKDIDHFKWAVRYQFGGERIKDIASGPGNEQAVDAAVRGVLRLVGLKRRRGKGRPKKS